MRSLFSFLVILLTSISIGIHSNAQLTPACTPTYTNSFSWRISSVSINNFSHSPTATQNDYTNVSFDVTAGDTYPLTLISLGWCGVGAAVDFNNDGDFDDPGEVFPIPSYVAADPATYTFDITIPANTPSGPYRFRVFNVGANSGPGTPPGSPCGSYVYGNWADYTMNVINTVGCQTPNGLTTNNITDSSVEIGWNASSSIPAPASYNWKVVLDGEDPDVVPGISGNTPNLSTTVNGLSNSTDYDFYVRSNCSASDTSAWSFAKSFTTLCSGTPTAGVASAPDSSCAGVNFTIELTGATAGVGVTYQWQESPLGANTWTDIAGATNITHSVTMLAATSYRAVVTCTGSNQSSYSNVIDVTLSSPSTCYCIPAYSIGCTSSDLINNFILQGENATEINDLNTGCSPGAYDDRTAQSVTLFQGVTYSGLISSNFSNENARIWIDFNDNGAFEASETVALISSISTTNKSFDLEVPTSAPIGTHRMRVRLVYSTAAGNIDPCANAAYGETHDYTVNIIAPSGCITPISTNATITSSTSATISWTPSPLGTTFGTFDYEVRTSGAPGSGPAGLEASGIAQADTFANLLNLVSGTTYELYVRTNCTDNTQSAWTNATEFTLPEYTPVEVTGFTDDVIANGVGSASSSTTNDVDGVNYVLVAQDFQASPTGPSPTQYLPNDRQITNGLKWYVLEDYSNDNSLRLPGGNQTGTLTFVTPQRAEKVYILGVSGSGVSNVNAVVNFTDNTTQSFTNLNYPDWFATTGNVVVSQVGRVNTNDNALGTGGPQLFENTLELSAANHDKEIESVTFTTQSGANIMNVVAISIKAVPGDPCTGTPDAGTLSSAIMTACYNSPAFSIASAGATTDLDITYAWRSSPAGANNWTNLSTSGVSHTVVGQLVATDYQFIVTCNNSGLSDTASITIGQHPNNECYCVPASANSDYFIDDFTTLNGLTNIANTGSGYSATGYGDFTSQMVSQLINDTVYFEAELGAGTNTYGMRIWVDWNQDGQFDGVGEEVYQSSSFSNNPTGYFVVPSNALTGTTRMRVGISYGTANGPSDPCSTNNDGEYEDYTIEVFPPCVGPTVNIGADTAICEGDTLVLDAGNPGLTYQWSDNSTDQQLTVTIPGTYWVKVSDGGCSTTDTITITLNELPTGLGIQYMDNGDGSFEFQVAGPTNVDEYSWDFGDGNTATGSVVTHQYSESGNYIVTVTLTNDCGAVELSVNVAAEVIGIHDLEDVMNVSVYPNPTKDVVNIEVNEAHTIQTLKVYNIVGQLIYENIKVNQNNYQYNTSHLATGVYTVEVVTENGTVYKKFEVIK